MRFLGAIERLCLERIGERTKEGVGVGCGMDECEWTGLGVVSGWDWVGV